MIFLLDKLHEAESRALLHRAGRRQDGHRLFRYKAKDGQGGLAGELVDGKEGGPRHTDRANRKSGRALLPHVS